MAQFETLYHKVLTDHQFRQELRANPQAALTSIGIDPKPEVLALLKNLESAVSAIAQDLDGTADTVPLMT
jgi:hypothetical protein